MKKVFALVLVSLFALVIGCGGAQPTTDTTTVEESATVVPDANAGEQAAGLDGAGSADDASMDDAAASDDVGSEGSEDMDAASAGDDASEADAGEAEM